MEKARNPLARAAVCKLGDKRLRCPKCPALKLAVRNIGNADQSDRLICLMDMFRWCSYLRDLGRRRIEKDVVVRGQRALWLSAPIQDQYGRPWYGIRHDLVAVAG